MPVDERLAIYAPVNGQTFFEGAAAFIVVVVAALVVRWLMHRHNQHDHEHTPDVEASVQNQETDYEFFRKIEEYQHDFD